MVFRKAPPIDRGNPIAWDEHGQEITWEIAYDKEGNATAWAYHETDEARGKRIREALVEVEAKIHFTNEQIKTLKKAVMRSDHIDRSAEDHHEHPHYIKPGSRWDRILNWPKKKLKELRSHLRESKIWSEHE